MEDKCDIEIRQVSNGFIITPADVPKHAEPKSESTVVFNQFEHLCNWLKSHFVAFKPPRPVEPPDP